ncbi:MAG: pyridoxal phosphate-dependent aminotransferase [Candidatus Diapherotrites archaeon]|nr:pyridoxal phosphate-dependent aminotransferase [Candidatus Diapherotrites archaeon]
MNLAKRMGRMGTEAAFDVFAEVMALRAQGKDVVSFCVGEPDFDTPQNVKQTGMNAIAENKTHYAPVPGTPELRKAIAEYVSKTRHVKVEPEEVIVVPGAKPILFIAMLSLVEEGDEVIYPNPGYPIYESLINFAGGTPVPLPLLEEKGFGFDLNELKKLLSPKTRMIVVNTPSNPTGGIISKMDLEELARICKEKGIWVLSDEIYSRIVYDGAFESIYQFDGMKERCILVDGHSKTYAMTGWRLGYGVMNAELVRHFSKFMNNMATSTATFVQAAGAQALSGSQEDVEKMVKEFRARRDLIVNLLNGIPGISCHAPRGAFYVFPNVTQLCREIGFSDSWQVQQYLLYRGGVGVLARTCFGSRNEGEKEDYIRLSYATSQELIREGLGRMKAALADEGRIQDFLKEGR